MYKYGVALLFYLLPVYVFAQNPGNLIAPPPKALPQDTLGQKDLLEILIKALKFKPGKIRRVNGKTVYFSLLPFGNLPTGGKALVTTTQLGFYLGPRKTTYISHVTFSPSTNLHGQFSLPFSANVWSADNQWNFQGDLRYSYIPQDTWGLGSGQPKENKLRIDYSYIRLYASALKKIKPYLFAGAGYDLDYQVRIKPHDDSANLQKFTGYQFGTANRSNSFSSGISLHVLFDTRVNSINPLPGYYANIKLRVNPRVLGSDDNWYSLYADARKYIPFTNKGQNMLALWSYVWTVFNSPAPYLSLPAIGWDPEQKSGRGIYSRRYTGNTLWYLEAEYRKDITANGLFGFVVFSNFNAVTEPGTNQFAHINPAIGTGLRVKFNKNSATNIGIDFGISKGYKGIYFNLGEAF